MGSDNVNTALKLKNVIMIIDNNNLQSLEKTSKTHPNLYPIEKNCLNLDGVLKDVMDTTQNKFLIKFILEIKKPFALIAETIKGYPVSYMMHKPIWHYKSPDKKQYLRAIKDLDKKL